MVNPTNSNNKFYSWTQNMSGPSTLYECCCVVVVVHVVVKCGAAKV